MYGPFKTQPRSLHDWILVSAVGGDGIARLEIEIDVLTGISPEAMNLVGGHLAALDVGVVYIGDFQLVSRRGLERANDLEDIFIVEINADDRPVALWILRFFDDAEDAVCIHFGHAVCLGVFHL